MRTSSNPAFRNLPTSPGGYARLGDSPAGMGAGGLGGMGGGSPMPQAGAADRPITVDDVVQKTAISIVVALAAGVLTTLSGGLMPILGIVGFVVGLVLSLVMIFKQISHPAATLGYSAAMGMALGAITGFLQQMGGMAGIGVQAVLGTFGVLVGMLVVYKTGAVRVTPRLTKMVIGAAIGVIVLMLGNLVAGFFVQGGLGLRDGGMLAIVFSLVCIAIGAFMLLLDFDQADQAVQAGVPAKFAWFLAFGFMTTLVWLYIEILRLLSYFRD